MSDLCPICQGSGIRLVEQPYGNRAVADCECRVLERTFRRMKAANIPPRYRECTLENFVINRSGHNESLSQAKWRSEEFVKAFPWDTYDNGLLFIGRSGTGKTHLAVGILSALIAGRGVNGRFVDCKELLKELQDSYNHNVATTERQILRPALQADVLVLDELGAARKTDWVSDMVEHILNMRYNDRKTTIITTNLSNLPARSGAEPSLAAAQDTLGDRIGERMLSRLHEMCFTVEVEAPDYRRSDAGRATFGPGLTRRFRSTVPE